MEKNNVYVGQRYVPKIMGEWLNTNTYEGLSIVTHQGTSYTSKKRVPTGIDISNEEYWVVTGNYNAQIEVYRGEVTQQKANLEGFKEETNVQLAETEAMVNKPIEQVLWKEQQDRRVNVSWFGVVGNGTTDDTLALTKAKNYCIENGGILYVPNYMEILVSNGIDLFGVRQIECEGAINCQTGEIEIGFTSTWPASVKYTIKNIGGESGTLKITGLKNAEVSVQRANKVTLYANGSVLDKSSIAYSKFMFGFVNELVLFSEGLSAEGLGGWINENAFYGGRIYKLTIDGNYSHNNNTFYKPSLEGSNVKILSGHDNIFHDVRFEGKNTLEFSEKTYNNLFFRTWMGTRDRYYYLGLVDETGEVVIINNGINNRVTHINDTIHNYRTVFEMNHSSDNYDLSLFTKNENNIKVNVDWATALETDFIPIITDFGVFIESDEPLWRVYIETFDSNYNKILDDSKIVSAPNIVWNASTSQYERTANGKAFGVYISKHVPNVKFIKIKVRSGNVTANETFNYLKLITKEPTQEPVVIPIQSKSIRSNEPPSMGTFNVGDKIENKTPVVGGYQGWICTVSGSPGTWKPYGLIQT